jgi:hypothetical protein
MSVTIAVLVPTSDQAELAELPTEFNASPVVDSRPFDGEAVVQALVTISTATYPFFRTWIRSRIEKAKHTSVAIDGITLKGYTSTEVENILRYVQKSLEADE